MRSFVISLLIGLLTTQVMAREKKVAGKPGVVVDAASITATVEVIDYDKRTVALKGPRGNIVVLKVGPDVKNFKQIKRGERVTTKYF
jgi:RNase P/RNase MRP subunit p29